MYALARHIIAFFAIALVVVIDGRAQHFDQHTQAPDPTKFLLSSVAERSRTFLAQDVYSHYYAKSFQRIFRTIMRPIM